MDGKSSPRSSHHFDAQAQASPSRRHRKPRTSRNALCDGNGRGQPQHHDQAQPLFNRSVAMSPEILREAEEQASSLKKAVKQLQDQLDKANREKARIHRFLSDLLYTLNARGYESVQDHEGTHVDLNKCKGETYLDLRGRDLKQRGNVRRQGGQEILLKAVIGNQERAIQTLVYKLDTIGRDILLGNRLCMDDNLGLESGRSGQENAKIASLETELLQLVNLIEGACQKSPEMFLTLRDLYYLHEEGAAATDMMSPRNPIIQNLLKKCEQIAGDAQSRQLIELLSATNANKLRPKSRQSGSSTTSRSSSKGTKTRSESKSKSSGHSKAPRAVSSDTSAVATGQCSVADAFCSLPPPPRSAEYRGSEDHLKPLNGGSKSESSFKPKGSSLRVSRSQSPIIGGGISGSGPGFKNSGGEPTPIPLTYSKYEVDQALLHDCSVTVCPYCHRKFGIEESVSEIKHHIEMHIFAGETVT